VFRASKSRPRYSLGVANGAASPRAPVDTETL
jgi:hypothetical protein